MMMQDVRERVAPILLGKQNILPGPHSALKIPSTDDFSSCND